ncbi:MAG: FAD-dependent oxidoreductase [Bacteroidota bacterium]|jgi:predicted NAD/FAD-binding protein
MTKPYLSILFIVLATSVISQYNSTRKVAVIGGGIAGVSAAHYILENDSQTEVVLFEKEKILGGNAKTVMVSNAFGDSIKVDIGPQFFTDDTWQQYITLLNHYDLISPEILNEFRGTFVIYKNDSVHPTFISPRGLLKRGERIKNLRQFYLFYKSAFRLFSSQEDSDLTVNEWLAMNEMSESFKNEIALPFMAATKGTTVNALKELSANDLVKLFAFRGPLEKKTFYVLNDGMGNAVQVIGDSLVSKGLDIKYNSPVRSIKKNGEKLTVTTDQGDSDFDFVVFAVHPYQAAKMLSDDSSLTELKTILNTFEYEEVQIVLHRDSSYAFPKRSFLNITTDSDNSVLTSTMNLSCIHRDYSGIYKSWMKDEDVNKVMENGTLIDLQVFEHPMNTPQFNRSLEKLYSVSSKFPNLYFAGGWTEGHETQDAAVRSGEKAAFKYRKLLDR